MSWTWAYLRPSYSPPTVMAFRPADNEDPNHL